MDHRAFMAGLAPEARAALTARSDAKGLRQLAVHLGAICGCGTLIMLGAPFWGLILILQGVLIVFLFTLEHETTHKTPFESDMLNEVAGLLAGFLLLLPLTWFRYFHLAHHRWTNIAGQDPELNGSKPRTRRDWVLHVSGLPYWLSQTRLMGRLSLGRERPAFLPRSAWRRARAEALVMLAGYALVLCSLAWSMLLFWVWLLPVVIGQPFLRLYLLAEHGDCPQVANMLLNTRTTFTSRAMRRLAWNMPYHTEHHVAPMVPFHRLPDLHGRMRANLGVTAKGYARFTLEYLARRRLPGVENPARKG